MQQDELLEQINKGLQPVLIDVRSQFEYKAGHIPGALHIPFWTTFFTDKLDGYDKESQVVLYCEHGPRAVITKLILSLIGFKKISFLSGHMAAWKGAALPMEK